MREIRRFGAASGALLLLGVACSIKEITPPAIDAGVPLSDAGIVETGADAQSPPPDASSADAAIPETGADADTPDATTEAGQDAASEASSDAASEGGSTQLTGPKCLVAGGRCAAGQACCSQSACGDPALFPCNGPVHVWKCTGRGSCAAGQLCVRMPIDALYNKSECVSAQAIGANPVLCETDADCPAGGLCSIANGELPAGVNLCAIAVR